MQNHIAEMRKIARHLSQSPGVYLMKDRLGQVIYVGKAKNLRKRVSSYFQGSKKFIWAQPKIGAMVQMVREITIHETRNETEALLLEGKLIKDYKPRYNTDFTDDKQFLLVRVDLKSPLPRFRLSRNRKNDGAHYYGPFAQAGLLRSTLSEMRKKFGILLHDAKPEKIKNGNWRLYDDARAEIFAGHNETNEEEYKKRVEEACAFLEGRAKGWLDELREEMNAAADSFDFERAAELRDLADALAKTIKRNRRFSRTMPEMNTDQANILEDLQAKLGMKDFPKIIECFDISHVSGTFVVASMVRFVDGKPDKKGYRRFKIKSFAGNDDFRAMEEVVNRRYARLAQEEREFPNLVVVDGGLGQVTSAKKAFSLLKLDTLPLIGLAKREETVVFSDEKDDLKMSAHEPALRLLQRVRDEAHRFANRFNADLRSKKIKESILDDFTGLGKVKREALMKKFGTLDRLKKADPDKLSQVEGIGPKLASRLYQFLQTGFSQ